MAKKIDIAKEVKTLENKLKHAQDTIAKDRDRLDALISEYQELKEHCQEAFEHLQDARDALSRLV